MKFKIKSNDQRQISDSHEFTFWLIVNTEKKVPAKCLDPASQALLKTIRIKNLPAMELVLEPFDLLQFD